MNFGTSIFITILVRLVSLSITIFPMIILGRLLTPENFGFYAILMSIQAIGMPLIDLGLHNTFLSSGNYQKKLLNPFFTLNTFLGIFISASILLSAIIYSYFFETSEMIIYIMVFSPVFIFFGLSQQIGALIQSQKRFLLNGVIINLALFFGAIIAIILAKLGFGVYSLIFKSYTEALVTFLLLYLYKGNTIKFASPKEIFQTKSHIYTGLGVSLNNFVTSFISSIDKIILSKFISLDSLGGFNRASAFSILPFGVITNPLSGPALVYFGEKKNDFDNLYINFFWVLSIISGIFVVTFALLGDKILVLLLGSQWVEYGILLQCLCGLALYKTYESFCLQILTVNRNTLLINKFSILIGITSLISAFIALYFSENLALFCLVLSFSSVLLWVMATIFVLNKYLLISSKLILLEFIKFGCILFFTYFTGIYFLSYLGFYYIESLFISITISFLLILILYFFFLYALAPTRFKMLVNIGHNIINKQKG